MNVQPALRQAWNSQFIRAHAGWKTLRYPRWRLSTSSVHLPVCMLKGRQFTNKSNLVLSQGASLDPLLGTIRREQRQLCWCVPILPSVHALRDTDICYLTTNLHASCRCILMRRSPTATKWCDAGSHRNSVPKSSLASTTHQLRKAGAGSLVQFLSDKMRSCISSSESQLTSLDSLVLD